MASKVDSVGKCICCGGVNEVTNKDHIEHTLCEAETVCNDCGFINYWAYGYFNREESAWKDVLEIRKRLGIVKTTW
jgi:hypothetical protein